MIQQARLDFGCMAGAQQVLGDIGTQIGIPNQEVHFTTSRLGEGKWGCAGLKQELFARQLDGKWNSYKLMSW